MSRIPPSALVTYECLKLAELVDAYQEGLSGFSKFLRASAVKPPALAWDPEKWDEATTTEAEKRLLALGYTQEPGQMRPTVKPPAQETDWHDALRAVMGVRKLPEPAQPAGEVEK